MTTSSRRPAPPTRGSRRPPRRPASRTSFLDRNRSRLLWGAGALVFVILAGMAYLGFTRPVYACLNEFAPTPAPSWVAPSAAPVASGESPAPAVTPPAPGYVQPDMGHLHQDPGSTVTYRYCPPASGRHYNDAPFGPVPGGLYGPEEAAVPPGWVHNLEHGAIVLLYKCPGPGCDDAGQQALEALLAKWPNSPICNFAPGQITPVIARFDDMVSNYMAVVWDVVLPMDAIDENALFDFYARNGERFNPEPQCPAPTPTPGPATPTPAASPTGSPAASPAPTGTAPAATTGPSPS